MRSSLDEKYIAGILKRFLMLDFKPLAVGVVPNRKFYVSLASHSVDFFAYVVDLFPNVSHEYQA